MWRGRPEGSIKQGSGDKVDIDPNDYLYNTGTDGSYYTHTAATTSAGISLMEYKHLLAQGVAPEMARMVLPQSTYTTVIANFTLAAAARFCQLRQDSHAQLEIQQYANAMSELISPLFPVSWAALTGGE